MSSRAKLSFEANKKDILMLWHIHREVAGDGPGRKHRVDVLNRAAIVFTAACWESYVEDVASEAFDWVMDNATEAEMVPAKVRVLAAKDLRTDKDERKIWELAGSGWRSVLQAHRTALKANWLRDFNTPKTGQVAKLFADLLDLQDLPRTWTWQGMSSSEAATRLDEYLTIRGDIAHRTRHNATVYKRACKEFVSHVTRIVEHTDEAIASHVASLAGNRPW